MKLPIKHEYFELIKNGAKYVEYRDAHITFIDEETKEQLKKNIINARIVKKDKIDYLKDKNELFEDDNVIVFYLY